MMYHIYLQILNQFCNPGMNPTSWWRKILLIYCWILFPNICWDFGIHVYQGYWPAILFCGVSVCFGNQGNAGFIEWVWNLSFRFNFLEQLEKDICINSALNIWYNSPGKPSGVGLLCVGRFLITDSISLLVMGLLKFSVSSSLSFSSVWLSRNLSISSSLSHLLACNFS